MANLIFDAKNVDGISNLINSIFSGEHDIIIDASTIHTIKTNLISGTYNLKKIDLRLLGLAIFYTEAMCGMLPLYENRMIMFPELKEECRARIKAANIPLEEVLKKYILGKKVNKEFKELKQYLEVYKRKLKRLDSLISRINTSSNPKVDVLTDLITYLNQKFEWKDISAKTVDEKIVARSILNAVSRKPTRAYTMDNGILKLSKNFLNLMKRNDLIYSKKMSLSSRMFLIQLKKANISLWTYNRDKKIFVSEYSNLNTGNTQPDLLLKQELINQVSNRLSKLYFSNRTYQRV